MKVYHFSKLAIFIAFSILIGVFADKLVGYLRYFIGALFLAYSLDNFVSLLLEKKKNFYKEPVIVYDFIQFIIGIIVLVGVEDFSDICIFWGVVSMLREAFEISDILTKKVTGWVALISAVESIVVIAFCIVLLFNPTEEHAKHHIYLLIVELIVTASSPVLNEMLINRKRKAY